MSPRLPTAPSRDDRSNVETNFTSLGIVTISGTSLKTHPGWDLKAARMESRTPPILHEEEEVIGGGLVVDETTDTVVLDLPVTGPGRHPAFTLQQLGEAPAEPCDLKLKKKMNVWMVGGSCHQH